MKFNIPFEWSERWARIERLMPTVSFSARTPKRICPACRGYDLERQWCDMCKRSGQVEDPKDGES